MSQVQNRLAGIPVKNRNHTAIQPGLLAQYFKRFLQLLTKLLRRGKNPGKVIQNFKLIVRKLLHARLSEHEQPGCCLTTSAMMRMPYWPTPQTLMTGANAPFSRKTSAETFYRLPSHDIAYTTPSCQRKITTKKNP
jgi:hypothetical protein